MRKSLMVAWLVFAPWAMAVPPASQPEFSDAQLRLLTAQLCDRSYHVRQQATEELSRLDVRQIDRLVLLYQSTSQPEQRFRLRQVAQAIFIASKRAGLPAEGFLGLEHRQTVRTENGRQFILVEVAGVVPDSPAAKAGLRPGDIIMSLFGQPISQVPGETFAEKIRRMAPGELVKLHVVRGREGLDPIVTLGDRTKAHLPEDASAEWLDQFRQFWREKFDPNDAMDGP